MGTKLPLPRLTLPMSVVLDMGDVRALMTSSAARVSSSPSSHKASPEGAAHPLPLD